MRTSTSTHIFIYTVLVLCMCMSWLGFALPIRRERCLQDEASSDGHARSFFAALDCCFGPELSFWGTSCCLRHFHTSTSRFFAAPWDQPLHTVHIWTFAWGWRNVLCAWTSVHKWVSAPIHMCMCVRCGIVHWLYSSRIRIVTTMTIIIFFLL